MEREWEGKRREGEREREEKGGEGPDPKYFGLEPPLAGGVVVIGRERGRQGTDRPSCPRLQLTHCEDVDSPLRPSPILHVCT